ncbi:MAG: cation:proton antiporter [Gammaproteobacteria bacterium]|nr:cation:proton antiporter [Gammaproteobacteria bacterium]
MLLGTSTALIVLLYRLHIASLLAFLITGALFGPTGLGVIDDPEELATIAELGLTFLLFILGLEFSLPRLIALRNTVFRLGSMQMLVCSFIFFLVLQLTGLDWQIALILAGGFSLSSTAIVSGELSNLGLLKKRHGEIAIGILLFQDLAAIVLLVAVPLVSSQSEGFSLGGLLFTIIEGLVLLAAFFFTSRYLLPHLLREIATQKSDQLLVLAALVIVLLSAMLTSSIGLSMELGAFLAGMMLGDTRFKHQLEADIRPFRDLLLGLFFITIGMLVDLGQLVSFWPYLLLGGLLLMITKALLITGVVKLLGESWRSAIPAGLTLAQGSEFLFALLALSVRSQLVNQNVASNLITIVIISMVMTPLLIKHAPNLVDSLISRIGNKTLQATNDEIFDQEIKKKNHILILGFGRVGQTIARFLRPLNIDYLVLETDDIRIKEASAADEPIFYGDSSRIDILKAAGAANASIVVVTFDDTDLATKIIENVKNINSSIPVLVRTRDDSHLEELLAAGAEEVIPETHEASLTMVSHLLLMVEYPDIMVHSIIDKARRDRYRMLKGFYHGERLGFLGKKSQSSAIIHAVNLPEGAFVCGKKIAELLLPMDINILDIHRDNLVISAEQNQDLVLQHGDIVVLRGLVDQLDAGESYLLQG